MKLAPVWRVLADTPGVRQTVVHTGQHYDDKMSGIFFRELELLAPDINLGVGSASHAVQTAGVMAAIEPCLLEHRPDCLVVYGDVNSTAAAALVAAKLGIPIAHVEAGLRSGDRSMPEEINRLVTDRLSDLLLTPSEDADENLLREGVSTDAISRVGNVMIDTLVQFLPRADVLQARKKVGLNGIGGDRRFILATLHRPSTVDEPEILSSVLDVLTDLAERLPVVLPVHPRTRARIDGGRSKDRQVFLSEPLGYRDFVALEREATLVITDSGGVQEETTYLGVPCLTFRDNTERPVTTTVGTNTLVGRNPERLRVEAHRVLDGDFRPGAVPPLWDGHAGERVAKTLVDLCQRV
jgi:UDP-N-acetylglucosamine 2-epimerase (non-hydrolysing)